ncbi:hypothetical protein C7M84_002556 [Penaeus vannamei]|uniref:Uncharacterized protein n=1 Tax=Penaeus vannamei TaxID=6689 RepID=A0A3R7PPN2_PENVA|nr:hypothetical protein C7M84_002556 [Penaeus vannamei]
MSPGAYGRESAFLGSAFGPSCLRTGRARKIGARGTESAHCDVTQASRQERARARRGHLCEERQRQRHRAARGGQPLALQHVAGQGHVGPRLPGRTGAATSRWRPWPPPPRAQGRPWPTRPAPRGGARCPTPSSRYDVGRDEGGWARGGGHPARTVGGAREAEAGASEGAWDTQARRLPSPSEGRPDTFGHRISEDLSHLDTEYSPRKSNRRWSSQVPSLHFSSASSGGAHGSFPQRPYDEQNSRWHNSRAGSASGNERSSTRFRNWDREERPSTSPRPSYVDYNAHEYPPRGSYNYPSRARDPVSHGDPYSNPASRGEPALLTIQQIKQMINISSHDEFFELLKKRGIGFSQLLEYMNRGANEDEVLQLLGYQRTTTTTDPPEARPPQTRLEDEHGGDAFDSQADSSLYFGEGAHRASQGSPFRGGAHLARDEVIDGDEGSTTAAEAEFKPPSSGTPNVGSNIDVSTTTQQPDDARPSTPAASAVLPGPSPNRPPVLSNSPPQPGSSTQPTFPEEAPAATSFPDVPDEASATQTHTLLTMTEFFPEPFGVVASATAPDVALPLPTSGQDAPTTTAKPPLKKSDPALTPRSSSSTLPSAPGDPYADDVTFPPGIRPSEVSIHSITVMKVPEGDETVPEVLAPASRRPNHRRPIVKAHFPPERNISRFTTTNLEEPEFEIGSRSILVQNIPKEEYQFPIKGLLIISGVLGAMAVFTLVILISYCIIKCSKPPAINNYRVTEQKPVAQ